MALPAQEGLSSPLAPALPGGGGITARAVGLGLVAAILINLAMAYNDFYLRNTFLIGNHFPVTSIVILVVLILLVNTAAQRLLGVQGLSAGELLLIWGMIGVAGGIGSAGIMRYFPSWVVVPAYYSNSANEYDQHILSHIPSWLLVSKEADSPAVKWFMEGMPRGASIPWGAWAVPIATWFAFALLLYGSNFALVSVFFQQWAVRERLIFPLVHLPLELTRPAPAGKLLNEFLSNRLMWAGLAIPCLIWGINGLQSYWPGIPRIPMSWPTWGWFADRPWSEFNLRWANLYFTVVGLTFLLTTEIAFSLWFFFVLYCLGFVYVAWLGAGATGFWGSWGRSVSTFESGGSVLVLALFLFWTARISLAAWLRRALAGRREPALDPLAPRLALTLIVLGVAGMVGWFLLTGASWWASVLAVGIFLAITLVLTRLIAEAGLMFVQTNVIAYDVLTGIFPPSWFGGATLNALMMQKAIFMHDLREIFMPYVMNGVRATAYARMDLGKVLAVFALTAVVGLAISAYGRIATSYKYGAVNMDPHANIGAPERFMGETAKFQKNPPNFDFVKLGGQKVLPVNVAHLVAGGLLTAGMLALRAKFLWWPLHPFGLVMCGVWAMEMIWFSIFLGWLAKSCVMTFGGAAVYRKVLPLFLGLVLGESLIGAFWTVVGLLTGMPGVQVLPY